MGRFVDKLFVLLIVLAALAGFREAIVADEGIRAGFDTLMGELPFAKMISDFICTTFGLSIDMPGARPTLVSLLFDIIKLSIMSILTPGVMMVISPILLPMPDAHWSVQEAYLDSAGYKLKEMIIRMIVTVILAFAVSKHLSDTSTWLLASAGKGAALLFGVVGAILSLTASIVMLSGFWGVALKTAILWRIAVTVGPELLTELLTVFLCFTAYAAFLNGATPLLFSAVITYFFCIAVVDLLVDGVKGRIVR